MERPQAMEHSDVFVSQIVLGVKSHDIAKDIARIYRCSQSEGRS